MVKLKRQTLVVVCGWPFSGKTTLAVALKENLCLHHVDIDELRWLALGQPHPHPEESPELMKRDAQEMSMSYRLLMACAHENLAAGCSLIITATFSRKIGQEMLLELMTGHKNAQLKIVQCVPISDTDEEVARRMAKRNFGADGHKGAMNSPQRYSEFKNRYEKIELPYIEIRTWGSENAIDDTARAATEYILS